MRRGDYGYDAPSSSATMRRFLWSVTAIGLLAGPPSMAAAPQQGSGAAAPAAEEVLQAFRKDLQSARADIMAKNLTLTADEAARFWPAYLKFQAEQTVIVD